MVSAFPAMAGEDGSSIQVLSGGRRFDSFEAYAQFKDPVISETRTALKDNAVRVSEIIPAVMNDVAGVTPPLAQVLREFEAGSLAGRPLCPRNGLIDALEKAAEGTEGPLLLVADGNKVRIMELKAAAGPGTNP